MAILGLGHVGIYVRDLEKMVAFYRDTLGMLVTKQNWRAGIVFLSADPERADHEIALFRGRPEEVDSRVINQVSLQVSSLDDLRLPQVASTGFENRCSGESCQRSRLLLLQSRRQPFGTFLGHRTIVLGTDRSPDRYRTVG
jgi:hypothetical protein